MYRKKPHWFYLLLFSALLFLSSCNTTKNFAEGQYMLVKNTIKTNTKALDKDMLALHIRQKSTRKILGVIRFHNTIYYLGTKGSDNTFRKTLRQTIGEEPTILDTLLCEKTTKQMSLFLQNKGYFSNKVSFSYTQKRKKAHVTYVVDVSAPYKVSSFSYQIADSSIRHHILSDSIRRLVVLDKNYDVDLLELERERITLLLRNKGYYYMMKDYITYLADTTLGNRKVRLILQLNQKELVPYKVKEVYISPNYSNLEKEAQVDTMVILNAKKSPTPFFIVSGSSSKIKPKVLMRAIFIKPNQWYNQSDVEQTYRNLSDLGNFKYSNILISPIEDSLTNQKWVSVMVQLTNTPSQSFTIETEGTNSRGEFGVAGNMVYSNKNLFRGAEIFTIKIKSAFESNSSLNNKDVRIATLPFNTFEYGVTASLRMPSFLFPWYGDKLSKYMSPKTILKTGVNYQSRPLQYTRNISHITFGYEWKESKYKQHYIHPLDISYVKIVPEETFLQLINQLNDKRLRSSYQDHFISAFSYGFVYNNQQLTKIQDFMYARIQAEIAGNVLQAMNRISHKMLEENRYYTLLNVRYAQYVRTNFDMRLYKVINLEQKIVYRLAAGVGIPYGNLSVLPFEKSFFAGGSNGIRAWQIRSLGPGGYVDSTGVNYDKTGDMQVEANVEYRFPVYKLMKGAIFLDAGNVWLVAKNKDYPMGELRLNKLLSDIALGTGVGIRLDFSFFIIRFDGAIKLRNPALLGDTKWTFKEKPIKYGILNFGIGYPF